jgi:hypothetical protein
MLRVDFHDLSLTGSLELFKFSLNSVLLRDSLVYGLSIDRLDFEDLRLLLENVSLGLIELGLQSDQILVCKSLLLVKNVKVYC